MKTIVEIKFGSHLYGTETENSDLDYKSIFIPDRNDILLQRAPRSIVNKRAKKIGEKNIPGEYDEEAYSLHYYIKLLLEGQTVALDMLFAPEPEVFWDHNPSVKSIDYNYWKCGHVRSRSVWLDIIAAKDKFISKKSAAFVGYCKQQANKYGIKGSRVSTVRKVLNTLKSANQNDILSTINWATWIISNPEVEHFDVCLKEQPGGNYVPFIEVCGKAFVLTSKTKLATECLQKMMDNYGARALLAERNEGVDWKALSHAVRVASQAIELFQTGNITFPLVNRSHILDIKLGKLPYRQVAEEIEDLLQKVNEASKLSNLPDEPDYEFAENLILDAYGKECKR